MNQKFYDFADLLTDIQQEILMLHPVNEQLTVGQNKISKNQRKELKRSLFLSENLIQSVPLKNFN